jgi:peptidyl-prolyl cis-trans isomerase D
LITQKLKQEKALALALADGEKKLASLKSGAAVPLTWGETKGFTRIAEQGVADADLKAIFKADPAKLPAFVGAAIPGRGYAIYKVTAAVPAPALSPENQFQMQDSLAKMYGQVEMTAFIESIKKDTKVKYNMKAPQAQ